jgi:hypothetical protein
MFGRGKPRLGGLTIEETLDRQESACKRQTSVRSRLVMAAGMMVSEMKCELELYEYVLVQT